MRIAKSLLNEHYHAASSVMNDYYMRSQKALNHSFQDISHHTTVLFCDYALFQKIYLLQEGITKPYHVKNCYSLVHVQWQFKTYHHRHIHAKNF